jgi:hypothetical protein
MTTKRGLGATGRRRDIAGQRGAIAILVGLSIFMLFAFMGLALDLARTYIAKTELQNAADAAALAGAKRLNQTKAGIDNAVNDAIAYAGKNQFGFPRQAVVITAADIMFAPSPDGPWSTQSEADANPAGLDFIQVNTEARVLSTLFMQIGTAFLPNAIASTSTLGYAVAGPLLTAITPIGICAITTNRTDHYADGELLQYGFRHGMSYDVMRLGPLGNNSVPWLINPVDQNSATCNPNHSSANFTLPFICTGQGSLNFSTQGSGTAIGNTGLSADVLKALNSRFGIYSGSYGNGQCDPATAPSDANIMQYCYDANGQGCPNQAPQVNVHPSYALDPNNQAKWDINSGNYQTVQLNASNQPLYNTAPNGTGSASLAFGTKPSGPTGHPIPTTPTRRTASVRHSPPPRPTPTRRCTATAPR